jgi:4-hydroxy-2-oxoheptanedioate aldolase
VVEIAAMSGVDCVWLCNEHVPNTLHDLENQIRAAKMFDVDTVVRVARGGYSELIRPLEMDATAIMVPHVMSLADAQAIVRQTRFHPIGRRPLDGGNADGSYCNISTLDYMQQANAERLVMIQIEDPEPLDELEEIGALEGIDILFFGPADFSQGIGAPCEFNHPKLLETRRRIPEIAQRNGKIAGTVAGLGNRQELIDMGYRFLNIGADVLMLAEGFAQVAAAFGRKPSQPAGSLYSSKN